jgi:hypothetical protein
MRELVTLASGAIVGAAIVGVGVLKAADLIDSSTADTAIAFVIGLAGGGAAAVYGKRVPE